jgi:SAM-dependent methyltransferase
MTIKPFFCSACFRPSFASKLSIGRESFNCRWCNATSRERAIFLQIHSLYLQRKIKNPTKRLQILGISDGHLTSTILNKIYGKNYANYHYHLDPKLDITNVPVSLFGKADIISCSEVLEHVAPPINKAFEGLYKLLKENGALVLSVPHSDGLGVHVEHFPTMRKSQLVTENGVAVLIGEDANGVKLSFRNLIFHGGIGATLEYRVFSEVSLVNALNSAGFSNLRKNRDQKILGVFWEPWSRVWVGVKVNSIE